MSKDVVGGVVTGLGLHTGAAVRVAFEPREGPLTLRREGIEKALDDLSYDGFDRSTRAAAGGFDVRTVEHLFAALAALGIRSDLVVEIDGPEMPLLDGGAVAFFDAVSALAISPSPPRLAIARSGTIEVGASRYDFHRSETMRVDVEIDFGDPRIERHASWTGDASDFRERIAPARTFAFEHELGDLLARGLASHVSRESVVVIGEREILSAGRPFGYDEPARHKLLDLIGDLYAHGGPPLGSVRAVRPGHARTHEAIARARQEGLLISLGCNNMRE